MLICSSEDFQENKNIGSKAKRLQEMKTRGFLVPDFVVVPADTLIGLIDSDGKIDKDSISKIAKETEEALSTNSFSVRSSALIEDGENKSYAGQFKTILDVKNNLLTQAIVKVFLQAYDCLNKDIGKFSIIIQTYIEPDYAGVCFTRNPNGGREMVIEYSKGCGEALVSGQNKPENLKFIWNNIPAIKIFQDSEEVIGQMKKLEEAFAFPQDIEWCLAGSTLYFLQSRPITTIQKRDYAGIMFLDNFLQKRDYHFEKTEISEIMPRPSDFSFGMLRGLYAQGGAIEKAYQQMNIIYQSNDFFQIIGNELYIDKEIERLTLFPLKSKKYLSNSNGIKDLWRSFRMTLGNALATNKLSLDNWLDYHGRLVNSLNEPNAMNRVEDQLVLFKKDYQLVFSINVLCLKAISIANTLLSKNNSLSISSFVNCHSMNLKMVDASFSSIDTSNFLGNSFDIIDESSFVTFASVSEVSQKSLKEVASAYNILPVDQKKIKLALLYLKLREMGRWLVVKRNSELRKILFDLALENNFDNQRLIYFATVKEVLAGTLDSKKCLERRFKYLQFNKYSFPVVISSEINMDKDRQELGISIGIAQGKLLRVEDLEDYDGPKSVLYTELLTPDLLRHFDKLAAIVSVNGGELSHLAILARESQIPVVSGFRLGKIKIGEMVEVDGALGIVRKL